MGKTILITGCSAGIGECAAKILQARGYRVLATARKAEDLDKLTQAGYEAIELDLNSSASIVAAAQQVHKLTNGRLDALFNNAGYGQPGAVEDLTRAALLQQFETNVFGLIELTNLIIPMMRQQGSGRIINVSSLVGLVAFPFNAAYAASKFALEALSDALRLELYGTGIYVSLIEPGSITTEFKRAAVSMLDNINIKQSIHKARYAAMHVVDPEQKAGRFVLPPAAVVKKLIHALESRKPKARYYVTLYTYVFAMFKRFLPVRLLDRAVARLSGIKLQGKHG